MSDHRSVSQIKLYEECAYRYQLQKLDKKPQRPAAWLVQGEAVHATLDTWEKQNRALTISELQNVYGLQYDLIADEYLEDTPNLTWWFPSGPYTADLDLPRRFEIGLTQLDNVLAYYYKNMSEKPVVMTNSKIASEVSFDIEIGGIPVRGFIDVVLKNPNLGIIIRDYKTGKRSADPMQLEVYNIALESVPFLTYPGQPLQIEADRADFFYCRNKNPSKPILFTSQSRVKTELILTEKFQRVDAQIRSGDFPANPSPDNCRFCPVRDACKYKED